MNNKDNGNGFKHEKQKKMLAYAAALAAAIIAGGCASYPRDREGQIKYHIKEAQSFISKGNHQAANFEFSLVLGKPGGGEQLRELFISDPEAQNIYLSGIESDISGADSTAALITAAVKLANARSTGLLPDHELTRLRSGLGRMAVNGNQSGRLPFTLADRVNEIPELLTPSEQEIMFDRTMNMVREGRLERPPVSAVMAYVNKCGIGSGQWKRAEALLPMMKIRAADLQSVEPLYAAYAAKRREEISGRVHLQVRNADRIFQEDLRDALKKSFSRIVFEPAPGLGITTITLDKIRHEERFTPERSETITYAQHEVNIVSAALLMPKNASYIYDVVKGANEIEYGFALIASYDGRQIHDQLLRGKVGGPYTRCTNARIQNVFGGVSSAGFIANSDMQSRCSSGGNTPKTVDELRSDVIDKLVDGILKVPTVSAAYDAN